MPSNGLTEGFDCDRFLSEDALNKILEENDAFIKAIHDFQRLGKVAEALELQKRLQRNLTIALEVWDRTGDDSQK